MTEPSHQKWPALRQILAGMGGVVCAVSGGVDSLLLATLAHRVLPGKTLAAHALSPAVPEACTERVRREARRQGWALRTLVTGEFEDERYASNPFDRCYFCKTHLYAALARASAELAADMGLRPVVVSGANTDDLGEHRPGLTAAREHGVRHPFVEAGVAKADIRAMARELGLDFADIPASPCLASRVYTGTRVTAGRMAAVALAEDFLKDLLGVRVVRCRIREDIMLVELPEGDRPLATPQALARLAEALWPRHHDVARVELDPSPYRPGRAFVDE